MASSGCCVKLCTNLFDDHYDFTPKDQPWSCFRLQARDHRRTCVCFTLLSCYPGDLFTRASCQASSRRAFSTHYPRRLNPSTATSTPEASSSSSSVSASEISHFTRLASSWWDPHGPSRLLHLMNPLRHDFIKTCLASAPSSTIPDPNPTLHLQPTSNPTVSPKHTILDIGCGGGIFSSSAARLPSTSRVVAIDPTPSVISVAKSHARSDPVLSDPNKLSYLNCSLDDLHSQVTLSSPSSSHHPPLQYHHPLKYLANTT